MKTVYFVSISANLIDVNSVQILRTLLIIPVTKHSKRHKTRFKNQCLCIKVLKSTMKRTKKNKNRTVNLESAQVNNIFRLKVRVPFIRKKRKYAAKSMCRS